MKSVGTQVRHFSATQGGDRGSLPVFSVDQVKLFRSMLSFLNGKDLDIFLLIFVSQKRQKEVQRILSRSQPSLCYDIKRIRRRLRFVYYLQSVFDVFVEFVSSENIKHFDQSDVKVLTLLFYTTSFTMTSDVLNLSQVKVRYAYDRCLSKMEELELWDIYEIFMVIRSNLNIVRRVYRGPNHRAINVRGAFVSS